MYRVLLLGLAALFVPLLAYGQDSQSDLQPISREPVAVVKSGHGVVMPVILPRDYSADISTKCEQKYSANVELALVVDSSGKAQNITFIKPDGSELDRLAIAIAQDDRFTPAHSGEKAVAIGASLSIHVKGCVNIYTDQAHNLKQRIRLASEPKQELKSYDSFPRQVVFAQETIQGDTTSNATPGYKIGGKVSAPTPIIFPDAEYSGAGRKKRISGVCLIKVLVDPFGLPEHAAVVRPLEPSMDEKALEAVRKYRFKPAMLDGEEPVPVLITVEVDFRLG